jgi:hypothetical protein
MEPEPKKSDLQVLSVALGDIRDSWVLMSMALKDHLADVPSPERDEVMVLVERQLARIQRGKRRIYE